MEDMEDIEQKQDDNEDVNIHDGPDNVKIKQKHQTIMMRKTNLLMMMMTVMILNLV